MKFVHAAFLSLAVAAAAGGARAQLSESVAATVNDELITTYDVRERAALLLAFAETSPTPEVVQLAEEQALRELIDEKLRIQEARDTFELEISDAQVDDALENIAQQSGTDLRQNFDLLERAGASPQTLRDQIRADLTWETLINGRYVDRIRVSEDQIDDTMERIARALEEPQFRVAEIFLEIEGAGQDAQALQEAQAVITQLEQGGNFPALAQQYSDAPTAQGGGDTGYQPLARFSDAVAGALQQMPVGGVAGPIRAPGGYYIIALIDKREAADVLQLTLKAVVLAAPDGATEAEREEVRARLADAAEGAEGCDAAEAIAGELDGAFVSDLGTLSASALQPQVRAALDGVEPGGVTEAVSSQLGAQVFVLCDRQIGGGGLPGRDEIAARLADQRRSMLERRYMRDLRREASIEIR